MHTIIVGCVALCSNELTKTNIGQKGNVHIKFNDTLACLYIGQTFDFVRRGCCVHIPIVQIHTKSADFFTSDAQECGKLLHHTHQG